MASLPPGATRGSGDFNATQQAGGGIRALQSLQMQLKLLEQMNKKVLKMASQRQEDPNLARQNRPHNHTAGGLAVKGHKRRMHLAKL